MLFTDTKEKPAPSAHALVPAKLVSLDIETCHATDKLIEEEIARWEPPSNMKDPEKIEARKAEAAVKIRERSALLDGSPIACVSARTERVGVIFNGVNKKSYTIAHSEVASLGNEKAMLAGFRDWLDGIANEATVLLGFNLISFDLPRLRGAFVRHRLRLPRILTPRLLEDERQPVVDVMRLFLKWFSAEYHNDIMISLDEVIRRLRMPAYKDRISGAEVPDLIKNGKVKEVLTYCSLDSMATLQAYLFMTSASADLE